MHRGYIRLYRKMLDNPIVRKDNDYTMVWIYILLNATHQDYPTIFKGEKYTLKPGQLITSGISIAENCNVSESKVRRILKSLKSDGQIEQQTSNKNRLITILNWEKYQDDDGQFDRQVTDNRRTSDGQVTTNKHINTETHLYKKENRKRKKDELQDMIDSYTDNKILAEAIHSFVDMRKSLKKPLTVHALKLIFNKLDEATNSDSVKVDMLNQSTVNCWAGVFELKNNPGGKKQNEYESIGWA